MRVVIQRVLEASVSIDKKIHAKIEQGLLILLGIEDCDTEKDIDWLVAKIVQLRIFSDENGLMNKSILDSMGDILVVSQFTLFAQTKKGNRPSFIRASKPTFAVPIYALFCEKLSNALAKTVKQGVFGADMQVSLINDGPVTIWIDTQNKE
ncbi:MAG: D-tyrosyl-tRNA(Tyr) deacylase [Paludibacteraceae bacterium]|nr:D-tyrosyl-tRNA(Tyr) deacylase [Paludibacteraceae bacterium]